MEIFAQKGLGLKQLSPPALSLKAVYKETRAEEPILMIISPGTDPSQELLEVAEKARQTLHEVALGQGQAELALEKLRDAMQHGQWLVLKNLHLMTFWVPSLTKEIQAVSPHKDFRLWLTAEPHPKFPSVRNTAVVFPILLLRPMNNRGLLMNQLLSQSPWENHIFFNHP